MSAQLASVAIETLAHPPVQSIMSHVITESSAFEFSQNLDGMLTRVPQRGDSLVINKEGKSFIALIHAQLFERIRRKRARSDALSQRLAQGFAQTPESEGVAEIVTTVAELRQRI